jgi:hypothetical protein
MKARVLGIVAKNGPDLTNAEVQIMLEINEDAVTPDFVRLRSTRSARILAGCGCNCNGLPPRLKNAAADFELEGAEANHFRWE